MTDTIDLNVSGMDCADCALTLEHGVMNMGGVVHCNVNFATAKMHVYGEADKDEIVARIRELGYGVTEAGKRAFVLTGWDLWRDAVQRPRNVLTLIGMALICIGFFAKWMLHPPFVVVGMFALGGLAGLYYPARFGWAAVRGGQGLDMNVLMVIAAIGAFAIGEYAEAAVVIVLFSLGEALEGFTMERARYSISRLAFLAPPEATVMLSCTDCVAHIGKVRPDGLSVYEDGPCPWCRPHEQVQPVDSLSVGDIVLVKPGERIPMDGVVLDGKSAVNQAPITGESMPVEKAVGADVYAGTINGEGVLGIEITHLAADNTLARMIHLVEEAQAQKTPAQRLVDRFARIYTPAVVIAAVLVAAIPPLIFGQPLLDTEAGHGSIYRALAMLVISCPCALVISTPVTVVSAISAAARRGVLIKGGVYLEALGKVNVMAFDKTGTLTHGRLELTSAACVDDCCREARIDDLLAECVDCDEILALAAAVERHSSHPIARAVVRASEQRQLPILVARSIETISARGVQGWVDGKHIIVGSHDLFHEIGVHGREFCEQVDAAEAIGQTTMLVSENGALRGYLAVSDTPRFNSGAALDALRRVGITRTVMLTGDNASVAGAVAAPLRIRDVRSNLHPRDKVEAVRTLVAKHGEVAMIGDGVNDAPALAAASVGIAMGGAGTAQALETADVALMADDLTQLPSAILLGRKAMQVIRFNIWFALLLKAVFLVAALFGAATLWIAVFADMGASLFVTLNGMRLLRHNGSGS